VGAAVPDDAVRGARADEPPDAEVEDEDAGLEQVLEHLREARGFDFTGYKRASLQRRVRRRMSALGIADHDAYLDRLLLEQDEVSALLDMLLINVTSFLRDAESWQYLQEQVVPDLLRRRPAGPLRFWSAGCATGQEPYSLAVVLAEALGAEQLRDRVKVYATDVDDDALSQARTGQYDDRQVEELPARARRYLEPAAHGGWTFVPEVRRSVVFGRNDLVQDAPISHVDLLLCRNTLMYFTAETQATVLRRLHFALEPQGVLFLGKAEMLLSHSSSFAPVELKRRFFRKLDDRSRGRNPFLAVPSPDLTLRPARGRQLLEAATMSSPTAQVVVDRDGRLAFSNFRADMIFSLSPRDQGQPLVDLPLSYRPLELRPLIEQAVREQRSVAVAGVEHVRPGGEQVLLDVHAVPLLDEDGALMGTSVVFEDVTRQRQLQTELEHANRQVGAAFEELQSAHEELETTNEELQSTVEELETTNEELQSTNEELETMNEELQSMNDELHISNSTLQERTDEVQSLNAFMAGVLSSLPAGIAVVDADLRVMAWNDPAGDLWGVRPDEAMGQPLLGLDIGLPLDALRSMLRDRVAVSGGPDGHATVPEQAEEGRAVTVLDAVNRRGRPVRVQVTVSSLRRGAGARSGAVVVMDVVG
jgi:two-component system, chemotaxis family, CheB/CheR fusion protein